ncbi:MAG: multiple sugar transport system substrate-binding protein [Parcubacteria group bacterium Gr01-1014_29]|nr:MAG: multiple sugar transport system substrate-binding protein [Parcubacteria group bacterium Gr01-1014_29]
MSKLQVGIYIGVIFITLIVVFIFLGVIPGLRQTSFSTTIVMWGIFPEDDFKSALGAWQEENASISIVYVQKNPASYTTELLQAIAAGHVPDIMVLPDTLFHANQSNLSQMPSLFMTPREYSETFTGAATSIFMQSDAIYGIPFALDPMVLYWNRDFFASDAIATPPVTWDEFLLDAQKLTKRTPDGNLIRAGAAMGLASNIPQSTDIVSLLILQGGTSIIDPATRTVTIGESRLINQIQSSPTETALLFYADFARREKTSYSWNHTFSPPEDAFSREDLAMFIGRASAYRSLAQRSAHISIGVSPVPQYKNASVKINYANAFAFTVPLQSQQQHTAWRVATFFAKPDIVPLITNRIVLAPARRDVLGAGHSFPPSSVFYEEALRSRTWYDPDPARSSSILKNMIESVAAGREASLAAAEARTRLESLLK